jgi:TRAP-type transport system small permease protein
MNPFETPGPASAGPLFTKVRTGLMRLDSLSKFVIVVAMAVMAGLVVGQVFFRYALSNSIDWAEEMARLAFVWAIFLAIPHGIRSGIHVGIDVVTGKLPPRIADVLLRLNAGLSGLLMAVIFYYSLGVVKDTWQELMPTVDITAAVYYIAVLIAAIHSVFHLGLLAWGGTDTWNLGGETDT